MENNEGKFIVLSSSNIAEVLNNLSKSLKESGEKYPMGISGYIGELSEDYPIYVSDNLPLK